MDIRPLRAEDERAARALVERVVAGTPYGGLPLLALERALSGATDEYLGLISLRRGGADGLALYGLVAGTRGAAKLHLVTGEGAAQLLDAVAADLRRRGARLMVAEVPDDRAWRAALEEGAFVVEGRIADYYRDGVHLLLMRREL